MVANNYYEEVIIAGFGGQGVMLAGKLLAQTAMSEGKVVTYMPAYGAEVRGGTANCMVIVTDVAIACPLVTKPGSLIAMNKASMNKFAPRVKGNGLIIMNSSLIDDKPQLPESVEILEVSADDIAVELGSPKSTNMVVLGAYLQKKGLSIDTASKSLRKILAKRYHNMLDVNIKALYRGAKIAENSESG
ncbi:MAG: 2-oxoacid:acceptor oxidoreductase family protein [Planctomycetota bacterium]|jgi:2-oxoglutarate ferredoxin oxidoreductase subunit gamma